MRVHILGGGLAGMVTALNVLRLGFDVTLYEARARLGGKAGSERNPPRVGPDFLVKRKRSSAGSVMSDHGYHVFPQWYSNMRHLWTEIGLPASDVFEGKAYFDLPEAIAGQRQPFTPEPPPTLAQVLAICELVLQPDEAVDDLTLQAFLYSRDFHRRDQPVHMDDLILNALTIGDADISSRAIRDVFRQWMPVFGRPNWAGLRGSLQTVLIDRLEKCILDRAASKSLRCDIHKGARVTRLTVNDDRRISFEVRYADGSKTTTTDEPTVIALPPEVLRQLDNPTLYRLLPEVSRLHRLRCNPFSALDIHFKKKLPDFPIEHFTLKDSPFGITGWDISQHWPEFGKRTVLQFVAANSVSFQGLDDAAFTRELVREIERYIPEVANDVDFYIPHRNFDAPLFVNDVGTWKFRPKAESSLPGVVFAGDYTQHVTDVTSMEGAVRSGRIAAEEIRKQFAPAQPPIEILPPPVLPPPLLALIELAKTNPVLARLQCLVWFLQQLRGAGPAP